MRARPQDLDRRLDGQLAPVYLISGDEPLQLGEAADAVRRAARGAGYTTREIFDAAQGFDWYQLATEANSLSLFADKKFLDLRVPNGKPGREGGAALTEYCARPPQDTLLLITVPKLDRQQLASKWAKAVDKAGVIVQVWPIAGKSLTAWIEQRLRRAGLEPAPRVATLLADRTEGNLLAAAQEIEKLLLLHGPGRISIDSLTAAVTDSARFDVFDLIDSALNGHAARCLRILAGLRGEGLATPVVLWAFAREIRTLIPLARDMTRGASAEQAMSNSAVWEKRKPLTRVALARLGPHQLDDLLAQCHRIDAVVKGAIRDDPWRALERLALDMSGNALLRSR